MIQDIAPKKLRNEYIDKKVEDNDYILIFNKRDVLVKKVDNGDAVEYIKYGYFKKKTGSRIDDMYDLHYLFLIDKQAYFLAVSKTAEEDGSYFTENAGEFEFVSLTDIRRKNRKMAAVDEILASSTAYHLNVWYKENRFCGGCGNQVVHDTKERMLKCHKCGNMIYPKIAPAVIVGLTDGDRILLTKYNNREYKRYALIAGFTEIGETAEETVAREVMEEVGLKVKNIHYYKSQPWGFDSNLLLGFFAEVDKVAGDTSIEMDEDELSVAEWVDRKNVPDYKEDLSLTHEMMKLFKESGLILINCK